MEFFAIKIIFACHTLSEVVHVSILLVLNVGLFFFFTDSMVLTLKGY